MVREGEGMLAGPCGQRERRTVTVAAAIIPATFTNGSSKCRWDSSRLFPNQTQPKAGEESVRDASHVRNDEENPQGLTDRPATWSHGHAHPGGGDRGGARH